MPLGFSIDYSAHNKIVQRAQEFGNVILSICTHYTRFVTCIKNSDRQGERGNRAIIQVIIKQGNLLAIGTNNVVSAAANSLSRTDAPVLQRKKQGASAEGNPYGLGQSSIFSVQTISSKNQQPKLVCFFITQRQRCKVTPQPHPASVLSPLQHIKSVLSDFKEI